MKKLTITSVAGMFLFLLTIAGAAAALNDDAVACYDMEGDANDALGNYNGTITGTPTTVAGISGSALLFNSPDDGEQYITITDIPFGVNGSTIIFWTNQTFVFPNADPTDDNRYFSRTEPFLTQNPYSFVQIDSVVLSVFAYGDGVGSASVTHGDVYDAGSWYMLALTKNGTDYAIYRNNTLMASTVSAQTVEDDLALPFYIGAHDGAIFVKELHAAIDSFVVWNRTLTEAEMTTVYDSGTGLNCSQMMTPSVPASCDDAGASRTRGFLDIFFMALLAVAAIAIVFVIRGEVNR